MSADLCLCARCAEQGKTCCQRSQVFATEGDVRRIAVHTASIGFYEYAAPANPDYADESGDPVWKDNVFFPDGTRRVLKRAPGGDCLFLGDKGCRLPLDVRPLVCRLHPLSYSAGGIQEEPAPGCLVELPGGAAAILAALNMNMDEARLWHRLLYAEICEHHDHHWFDLRPAV